MGNLFELPNIDNITLLDVRTDSRINGNHVVLDSTRKLYRGRILQPAASRIESQFKRKATHGRVIREIENEFYCRNEHFDRRTDSRSQDKMSQD
ncbi:hypothetical protein RMSM_05700 [Rhodopirellula maiorica SM1]|uniref:Uncharacterized protein n=1 Tax=Rhodopirellula maiorica SM1 TaxID=1265738 RepID=M5RE86_9BACT|nr:hypothetical protein RMSM_05700 [Rhodopirellula maiorica SM1]